MSNKIRKRISLAFIIGCFISSIIITVFFPFLVKNLLLTITVFFSVTFLTLLLAFIINLFKDRISEKIFGVTQYSLDEIFSSLPSLVSAFKNKNEESLSNELNEVSSKVKAKVSWFFYYRFLFNLLTILFLFFGTLIGAILLYNQNELVKIQNQQIQKQNILFEKQNRRLDQQTNLQEAERRSSLVFLLGEITSSINRELLAKPKRRILSDELKGQIIALSQRLKPYKYLNTETDSLTGLLSPERAQLLITILESKLEESEYEKIFEKADFSYSEFNNDILTNYFLKGAYLAHSEFHGAILDNSNLNDANLYNSDLSYASLKNCYLEETNFHLADLSYSIFDEEILKSNLFKSDLSFTDFTNFNLENSIIDSKKLFATEFRNVKASGFSFFGMDLSTSNFQNADLTKAVFTLTDLQFTDLRGAKLDSAILYNSELDYAEVDNTDWIDKLVSPNKDQIKARYKVEKLEMTEIDSIKKILIKDTEFDRILNNRKVRKKEKIAGSGGGWGEHYYLVPNK